MSSPVFSLPLSDILPIAVVVSPAAVPGPVFNQGLVVGATNVIPTYPVTTTSRLRLYTNVTGMLTDGFTTSSPEYIAATLYFGQTPAPTYLWVGRQNLTAIATVTVGASGGTGYVVGDILTVTQAGASGGFVSVTTIGGSGAVTGVAPVSGSQGTNYSIASNLSTTGGTGTGAEVDITGIGETPLQAVAACRIAQPAWYGCTFVGTAADSDYEAIAGFIEAATPASLFFLTSGEAAILNNTTPNLFATLQGESYRRTLSVYSTTQGGNAPNNIYASAGVMGRAMGLNTGSNGSYFTLMFKNIVGVLPEPLNQTQVNAICGTVTRSQNGLNGNVIVTYANNAYQWVQNGTMSGGTFFDIVMFVDMLVSDCQYSGVNLLTSVPSVPITNQGVTQFSNVFSGACQRSQALGFIASSGIWQGVAVGGNAANGIGPGDALPVGYYVYAPPVSSLSAEARAARQMPPFTILIIAAEAAQSLAVTINVQL